MSVDPDPSTPAKRATDSFHARSQIHLDMSGAFLVCSQSSSERLIHGQSTVLLQEIVSASRITNYNVPIFLAMILASAVTVTGFVLSFIH